MYIHNLQKQNSVLQKYIAEIRDVQVQKDSMRFRKNMERIAEILSYELSKTLHYQNTEITTPLGTSNIMIPEQNIVVCAVLRAGLSMHNGVLNRFDLAENCFISAYRKHTSATDFTIEVEYVASPSLQDKVLIIVDPMLATGQTFVNVLQALQPLGAPKSLHLMAAIGSQPGVDLLENQLPKSTHLWIAAIDEKLNTKGYIIPGLGDAGDLCYGSKMQG